MTINASDTIKKFIGWCPLINSWTYKTEPAPELAHPPISPINSCIKWQLIRPGNVIFPANGSLLTLCSVIGFTLLFNQSRHLDYSVLLMGGIAMCVIVYFLAIKSFQANIPLILMLEKEQEKHYYGPDTQLYIESRKNKWWYELSPYYSIITEKNTADRMRASIEQYMKVT